MRENLPMISCRRRARLFFWNDMDMAENLAAANKFALSASRHFPQWLAGNGGRLGFTTYQAGKIFLVGTRQDGSLSVFERTFPRSMGVAASADGRSLVLATHFQIHRFDNVLPPKQANAEGFDAVY